MKSTKVLAITCLLLLLSGASFSQAEKTVANVTVGILPDSTAQSLLKPQKSITKSSVTVEGTRINYQAVAGTLILKNQEDKPTCSMFYTAYFKSDVNDVATRPLTFVYGGGPGVSTFILHTVAWGPQVVYLNDTAFVKAPFKTVNNDNCLLDASDLVFIDAPGTGFSQIITKDKGGAGEPKDFYGTDPDAGAFADFITKFLSMFQRWNSPKYLLGESYGTFRSAALSNILESQGVGLNGIIQLSSYLNYGNIIAKHNPGVDLPYELALPSYAAVAWYHHKIPNRPEKLETFLEEVKHFAMTDYAYSLSQGSLLDSDSFNKIAERLHAYTGLPVSYITKANLRVGGHQFQHELVRDDGSILARTDGRFTGYSLDPLGEWSLYDPGVATIISPLVATFNNYVRTQLNFYDNGMNYQGQSGSILSRWNFIHRLPDEYFNFYTTVMPDLASAMIFNPNLKVMLNMGYFDMATPFYAGMYEMHHLPIPAALQKNIEYNFYHSGHFIFLNPEAHKQLHDNVARFINSTH